MNILFAITLGIISFIPIILWAYTFAFISDNPLNRKRFIVGIFGGAIAVFPILYMDTIIHFLGIHYLNVFYFVRNIQGFFSGLEFSFSLISFLGIIIFFSLLFGILLFKKRQIFLMALKNFLIFIGFIIVLSGIILLITPLINFVNFPVSSNTQFGDVIFDTLKLIIFYYIIVAFIEEASKHFNFLQSSALEIKDVKTGVEYAIFVALGFSFIENILYLYNFIQNHQISFEVVKLYFFRSVFSVFVHILCSTTVGYYFSKALLHYKVNKKNMPYIKVFGIGLFVSILLHMFFDVSITLGLNIIIFIYFIGGYLYISSIFYKENEIQ